MSVFKVLSKLRLWNCHIRLLSLTTKTEHHSYCCDLPRCRVLVAYALAIIHFQSFCKRQPSISLAALLDNFVCFYILVTRKPTKKRQTDKELQPNNHQVLLYDWSSTSCSAPTPCQNAAAQPTKTLRHNLSVLRHSSKQGGIERFDG